MIEQNSNFFDQLDGGWGDLIADTYEEYSNEKYILQFEGTDEYDDKINIKIKTDVEKLIMQCQYEINFSELGDYINSFTVVKFPSDVEFFVDDKLSENKYNGMYIHYINSTTNKNMCSASIVLDYYDEKWRIITGLNYTITTRLNYTPYKKRNGNKAKFSDAFKYKIINEFETDPFYDSSFNIDPSEFKPQIDEQLYAIKYVLNN